MRSFFAGLLAATALALGAASEAGANPLGLEIGDDGAAHLAWPAGSYPFESRITRQDADGSLGPVSAMNSGGDYSQFAVDPAGRETVSWVNNTTLRARQRSADGTLGPIRQIASDIMTWDDRFWRNEPPRMAVDDRGGVYFVWVKRLDGQPIVQGRRLAPDGSLSSVQSFGSGYYMQSNPEVAVDAVGNTYVVWRRLGPDAAQMRRRTPGGALGPTVTLSTAGESVFNVQVGVAADGTAVFAWNRSYEHVEQGWRKTRVLGEGRVRRPDGTLGPRFEVVSPGDYAGGFDMTVARDGAAYFAWAGTAGTPAGVGVRFRRRDPSGELSPAQTVSSTEPRYYGSPGVAVDASGAAVVKWVQAEYYASTARRPYLMARRRLADGTLGATAAITGTGNWPEWECFDVAPDGTATFLWKEKDDTVRTRRRTAGGARSAVVTLPG